MYRVAEDSLLVKRYVESMEVEGKRFLEVGAGSGETGFMAAERGAEVTLAEKDPEALEHLREKAVEKGIKAEIVESDIMDGVDGSFDIAVFNPPYLPGERRSGHDPLVGGENGTEMAERFLEQVQQHLVEGGVALTVVSDRAETEGLERFDPVVAEEKKLWFEKLYLLKARKQSFIES